MMYFKTRVLVIGSLVAKEYFTERTVTTRKDLTLMDLTIAMMILCYLFKPDNACGPPVPGTLSGRSW